MSLTATPSGEVAQMLTSASSEQGLNRVLPVALLRVRTWTECPEDKLRELTGDINPNCGVARESETNKKRAGANVRVWVSDRLGLGLGLELGWV